MARKVLDTVVCDVGDVIIKFDTTVATDIERQHGLEEGTLLPTLLKSPSGQQAMVGAISDDAWLREANRAVGPSAVREWLRYHGDLDVDVVADLKSVRDRGVRVVLLSNATARLHDDLAFHGLLDLADRTLGSYEIGQAKPDVRCYREAARLGVFDLGRALYVDDTPSWVAAGEALGMTGHTLSTADRLHTCLITAGLLT